MSRTKLAIEDAIETLESIEALMTYWDEQYSEFIGQSLKYTIASVERFTRTMRNRFYGER